MRIASIDIGTNSVLLLIAEFPDPRCQPIPLVERSTITRLGQGVDRSGQLHPEAVQRTLSCLEHYAQLVAEHAVEHVRAVTTSAARDARGVEQFLREGAAILGTDIEVISGSTEARLAFQGATTGIDAEGKLAVFDLGGGSTEIIVGDHAAPDAIHARSVNVGAVRLTERHMQTQAAIEPEQIDAVRREALDAFERIPWLEGKGEPLTNWVGIGGTVTTLAAIHQGIAPYDPKRIHGTVLTREDVQQMLRKLASMPLQRRRQVPGLNPKRADVIVAGAAIVDALLSLTGRTRLTVSTRGVRWGLAIKQCQSLRARR